MGAGPPTFNPTQRNETDYGDATKDAISAAQGARDNYKTVFGQQQAFGQQLQGQINGTAPSIADLQLKQALAQNNAAASSLAATTAGASTNPGLAQRQALQAQATNNQVASGQGALNRLAERNAAQQEYGNLLGQEGGQSIYNEGAQTQQVGTFGGLQENQNAGRNAANTGSEALNEDVWKTQQNNNQALAAAGINGGATLGAAAVPALFKAEGGEIPEYAHGGPLSAASRDRLSLKSFALPGRRYPIPDAAHGRNALARASANASPTEQATIRSSVHRKFPGIQMKAAGGPADDAALFASRHAMSLLRGGGVPGHGRVAGDSYANDTVPAVLSPKEIVLPRSVTMSADAPERAAEFVRKIEHAKGGQVGPSSYAKLIAVRRKVQGDLAAIDKLLKATKGKR